MAIIYLLRDPRGSVRYVGQSTKTASHRLKQHISDAKRRKTHVACWIRALSAQGLSPIIHVVEQDVQDLDLLDALEREWINSARLFGWDITNNAVGGRVNRGQRATAETRRKLSEAHIGRKESEATRAKMSATRQDKAVHTEESRRKIGAVHVGKQVSEETRTRMSAAARARAPETRRGGGGPVGYRHTEEARAKMRQAVLARRAQPIEREQ